MPKIQDNDLEAQLTELAGKVLTKLNSDDGVTLDQRLDGLKVIGTLHLGLRKLNGKTAPDEEGTGGLVAARERMRALAEGDE